jgi:hypothetical protein
LSNVGCHIAAVHCQIGMDEVSVFKHGIGSDLEKD